jgi:hypothetical protein
VVIAVNVSPKTVLPLMVTVPDNAVLSVLIAVAELAGDAKWVRSEERRVGKECQ